MALKRNLFILLSLLYLLSCDLDKAAKMQENLPQSAGKPGEIIVVIDSAQWEGEVGKALRETFHSLVPFIPREETMFALNKVDPKSFQSILKIQKNIIFVTVLGDKSAGNRRLKANFTPESLEMIKQDPSLFMFEKQNEFAKGQEVLHLFGETSEVLASNIDENRQKLRQHFQNVEAQRQYDALYSVKWEKGISNHIKEKLECEVKVPIGYEIAVEDDDFIWMRSFSPDVDKNFFISWTDYTSEDMFSLDSLLKLRTELSRPFILYKPEDSTSYMLTEIENFDISRKEINFKGHFAVELRGLWKVNNYYMGGPFISYAIVDNSGERLYYIEAFLYSPGKPQREYMRELETILKTFEFSDTQVEASSK